MKHTEDEKLPNMCNSQLSYKPAQDCVHVMPHECEAPTHQMACRYFAARPDIETLCLHGLACCHSEDATRESTIRALKAMIAAAQRRLAEVEARTHDSNRPTT